MKTLKKEIKDGTTVNATEFYEIRSAIRFMREKELQNYIATFPERTENGNYIVYTWRKENQE